MPRQDCKKLLQQNRSTRRDLQRPGKRSPAGPFNIIAWTRRRKFLKKSTIVLQERLISKALPSPIKEHPGGLKSTEIKRFSYFNTHLNHGKIIALST